jgi:endonuclease/exonuclease/phosphatase family metal-dependent hydrolase
MKKATLTRVLTLTSVSVILFSAVLASATSLKITSFNIEWFGNKYDNPRSEQRQEKDPVQIQTRKEEVKKFLNYYGHPDVYAFQEIVDVRSLQDVLPAGWSCMTYDIANELHQHVVLCASPKYRFLRVPYDSDDIIDAVATDREWSRPALRVDLADQKGRRLLRIVSVHLKAMPMETKERLRQSLEIANDLKSNLDLPSVVVGDFNSFTVDQSKQAANDVDLILQKLQQADPGFQRAEHVLPYTYRRARNRAQFDHFYYSSGVELVGSPRVFEVCSKDLKGNNPYYDIQFFNQWISDHCPAEFQIKLTR